MAHDFVALAAHRPSPSRNVSADMRRRRRQVSWCPSAKRLAWGCSPAAPPAGFRTGRCPAGREERSTATSPVADDEKLRQRSLGEPGGQRDLVRSKGTRPGRRDEPPRPRSKSQVDALTQVALLGQLRNEDRSEGCCFTLGPDLVVVRPATATLVLPVTAELNGHGGPGRSRISAAGEAKQRFVNERVPAGSHRPQSIATRSSLPSTWPDTRPPNRSRLAYDILDASVAQADDVENSSAPDAPSRAPPPDRSSAAARARRGSG